MLLVISTLQAPVIHTRGSIKLLKNTVIYNPCLKENEWWISQIKALCFKSRSCMSALRTLFPVTVLVSCYNYHFNTYLFNPLKTNDRLRNTLRTGDADLRFYITTVQDGWHKSAFLTRTCFPCTMHLIMQYVEPIYEWSCWRMFIETWPHSELTLRHRASSI